MVHVQKVEHQSKREQDAPARPSMHAGREQERTNIIHRPIQHEQQKQHRTV